VDAEIPAPKVLQIATLGAACVMKHDGQLGSIAPGKLADLVIIDGNPTVNIHDLRNVITVIKDGNVFARGAASDRRRSSLKGPGLAQTPSGRGAGGGPLESFLESYRGGREDSRISKFRHKLESP
jgi:adenine deaminase